MLGRPEEPASFRDRGQGAIPQKRTWPNRGALCDVEDVGGRAERRNISTSNYLARWRQDGAREIHEEEIKPARRFELAWRLPSQ